MLRRKQASTSRGGSCHEEVDRSRARDRRGRICVQLARQRRQEAAAVAKFSAALNIGPRGAPPEGNEGRGVRALRRHPDRDDDEVDAELLAPERSRHRRAHPPRRARGERPGQRPALRVGAENPVRGRSLRGDSASAVGPMKRMRPRHSQRAELGRSLSARLPMQAPRRLGSAGARSRLNGWSLRRALIARDRICTPAAGGA